MYTLEPPNNGHTWDPSFVLCREVVLFWNIECSKRLWDPSFVLCREVVLFWNIECIYKGTVRLRGLSSLGCPEVFPGSFKCPDMIREISIFQRQVIQCPGNG